MAEKTAISWATSTFNPWIGCTKVGPGCDRCYAETLDKHRFSVSLGGATPENRIIHWGVGAPRYRKEERGWREPFKWNDKAARAIEPWRVFCASLADVFDNEAPVDLQQRLWGVIERTPNLTWMLLTKRIGRWIDCVPQSWLAGFPSNVWMGATVVNQEEVDRDIPKLLKIPARVRWLSIEPQLGPITLRSPFLFQTAPSPADAPKRAAIDWVVVGGESYKPASEARPFVLGWAKDLVRECREAGVAVHVKQMGSNPTNREGEPHPQQHWKGADMAEWPEILRVQEFPT